jgi:hypothetical protein
MVWTHQIFLPTSYMFKPHFLRWWRQSSMHPAPVVTPWPQISALAANPAVWNFIASFFHNFWQPNESSPEVCRLKSAPMQKKVLMSAFECPTTSTAVCGHAFFKPRHAPHLHPQSIYFLLIYESNSFHTLPNTCQYSLKAGQDPILRLRNL